MNSSLLSLKYAVQTGLAVELMFLVMLVSVCWFCFLFLSSSDGLL